MVGARQSGPFVLLLAVTATTGGVDFKHIARCHFGLTDVAEFFHRAVVAHDAATGRTKRAAVAAVGQGCWPSSAPGNARGGYHRRHRATGPRHPSWGESRSCPSCTGKRNSKTSGSVKRELVMWVCTTLVPLKPFTRTRTTRDGFVVLVGVVAKGEVVHRALACCHGAQRAVERIGDAGRRFHIARHHRGRRQGLSMEPSGRSPPAVSSNPR
jgi:hypothetical protein